MPKIKDYKTHFETKFKKTETCWVWQGSCFDNGYGQFKCKGKNWKAHRYSYTIYRSDPGTYFVCHTCDNPKCVNPAHLFLGTAKDNKDDCVRKNRHAKHNAKPQIGKKNGGWIRARFNKGEIDEIKNQYTGKRGEQTALAKKYGVSVTTICSIINNRRYKDIPDAA